MKLHRLSALALVAALVFAMMPMVAMAGNLDSDVITISVNPNTGALTANVAGVTSGVGTVTYKWAGVSGMADDTNAAATVALANYTLGQPVTLTATDDNDDSTAVGTITVYRVDVTPSGATGTDSATITDKYGKAGDPITISYTLGNTGTLTNTLTYTLKSGTIPQVATPATSTSSYTIASADATNGVISIAAAFAHTNKPALSGTVKFTVNAATGEVTALASGGNTASAGVLTYTWTGAGAGTTGTAYSPTLAEEATCTVSGANTEGTISAKVTVYKAKITKVGDDGADAASITNAFIISGSSVTIDYKVDSLKKYNTLTYSGVANPPAKVSSAKTSTSTFTMAASDASRAEGQNIIIVATFDHTNTAPSSDDGSYGSNQAANTPKLSPQSSKYNGYGNFTISSSGFYNYFDPNRSLYANGSKLYIGEDYDVYNKGGFAIFEIYESTMQRLSGNVTFKATFTNGTSGSTTVNVGAVYIPNEIGVSAPKTGDNSSLIGFGLIAFLAVVLVVSRRIRAR